MRTCIEGGSTGLCIL